MKITINPSPNTPTEPQNVNLLVDSAATHTLVTPAVERAHTNTRPLDDPLIIRVANVAHLLAATVGDLPLPTRTPVIGHITPGLAHSLFSVADLVDTGLNVTFTANGFHAHDGADLHLHGPRDTETGLWHLTTLTALTALPLIRCAPSRRSPRDLHHPAHRPRPGAVLPRGDGQPHGLGLPNRREQRVCPIARSHPCPHRATLTQSNRHGPGPP
mmetsp:Transcript_26096/g.65223  ORF Transcript_26096/g.65223 Transcript_26096/m.65223 type:complete len:214 (+) Transcript_26096:427-1068(+)